MTGKVFTVAQQKGGAGKSTLAAHLAVAWARTGKSVAIIDIDPQASLENWFEARIDTFDDGNPGLTFVSSTGWRSTREVSNLARGHDVVVVDSPPHAETESRIAVRAADMVVIPAQPSPLDVWATLPTVELAHREKSPAMIVLNRVPPRANLTAQMVTKIGGYPVKVARNFIGNRVVFAESMGSGRTAMESRPSSVAAKEIRALARELLRKA